MLALALSQQQGGAAAACIWAAAMPPPLAFLPSQPAAWASRRRQLGHRRATVRGRGGVTCGLTVLRERTLRRLLPAQFTGDQWKYYWGITESDKFGKVYEALSATFFGLWISWFLTFLIGLPASTILGTVFLFYWLLAPGLGAYRRNVSFRGTYFARNSRDDGVFGALFSGRVVRVGRITQSREYNRPEALVMCVEDDEGRKLRVYAPLQPSYRLVRPGMRCEGLVLSETPGFEELLGVSDIFVPACGAWVGDYPYLDKVKFKDFLASKLRKERERRKGSLQRMKAGLLGAGQGEGDGAGLVGQEEEEEEEEDDEDAMPVDFVLDQEREGELLPVYDKADEEVFKSIWANDGGSGQRGQGRRRSAAAAWNEDEEDDDEAMMDRMMQQQEERRRRRREQLQQQEEQEQGRR